MPTLLRWLTGGGLAASQATSRPCAATVYQAITQAQQGLLNQIATNSVGALAGLYNQQTDASTAYLGTGVTSTTTGSVYWYTDTGTTIVWEDQVTPAQYLALAHQRVGRTEEMRRDLAERQQERTEAHQRQIAEDHERWYREHAAQEEQRRAALARSRELLLQHLTPAQRKTFEENSWFIVQGGSTRKHYRIRTTGYTGNIEELAGRLSERVTYRLCGHLRGPYALHDHHVAQKISLEYDEEAFVRICNRHAA